jgi:hypothetical protein
VAAANVFFSFYPSLETSQPQRYLSRVSLIRAEGLKSDDVRLKGGLYGRSTGGTRRRNLPTQHVFV